MKHANISIHIIVLAALFMAGCSEVKGPYFEPHSGDGSPTPPTPSESIFPHTDGWEDFAVHGKYVVDNGSKGCISCHDEDSAARSCKSCHTLYPHPPAEEWQGLNLGHGRYLIENDLDTGGCKTACHGIDLKGEYDPKNKKNCNRCHTSYPHKHDNTIWSGAGHGDFITTAGNSLECSTMCHRKDVPNELKITGCDFCHSSYPDVHKETGWTESKHPSFLADYGGVSSSDCTTCHGANLKGGSSEISCYGCHDKDSAYPLHTDADWATSNIHGFYYRQDGLSCKSACHSTDLSGGISGKACSSCHDNWPHESGWLENHGESVLTSTDEFDQTKFEKCSGCHGAAEKFNNTFPSINPLTTPTGVQRCYSCHSAYPHIGFKDYVTSTDEADVLWPNKVNNVREGGHWYYILFNEEFRAAAGDNDILMSLEKGCAGDNVCHKSLRQGPSKRLSGYCSALCHK